MRAWEVLEGLKRRILRSEEPVSRYWPEPAEKARAWTGPLCAVRWASGVVGKGNWEGIASLA
jgi:hypothetical protein